MRSLLILACVGLVSVSPSQGAAQPGPAAETVQNPQPPAPDAETKADAAGEDARDANGGAAGAVTPPGAQPPVSGGLPTLNLARLRDAVQCEWTFSGSRDVHAEKPAEDGGLLRRAKRWLHGKRRDHDGTVMRERGWVVYRYFEPGLVRQRIGVAFLRHGKPLAIDPAIAATQYEMVVEPSALASGEPHVQDRWMRLGFQTLQMMAALLVPLATLAITTAGEPTSGRWWDLVAIGFGSEAIRNILTSESSAPTS